MATRERARQTAQSDGPANLLSTTTGSTDSSGVILDPPPPMVVLRFAHPRTASKSRLRHPSPSRTG